jgi:tetrahydromethanopterin S-methyltransferase subunit F
MQAGPLSVQNALVRFFRQETKLYQECPAPLNGYRAITLQSKPFMIYPPALGEWKQDFFARDPQPPQQGDGMSTRTLGIAMIFIGILLMLVSLLADVIGVGWHPEVFGWKQILGTAAGVVLSLVGVYLLRRK